MAKKTYIGVDGNVARNVKKIYIGVDGVARQVKKAYIGDKNGIARLVYSSNLFNIDYIFRFGDGGSLSEAQILEYFPSLPRSAEAGEFIDFYEIFATAGYDQDGPFSVVPRYDSPLYGIVQYIYSGTEWNFEEGRSDQEMQFTMPSEDITVTFTVYLSEGSDIPDATTYNIEVSDTAEVRLSLNKTIAYAGDRITISISISGSADVNSAHVAVTNMDTNETIHHWSDMGSDMISAGLSFTMPAADVLIEAWSD